MAGGAQKVYAAVKSYSQRGNLLTRADLQGLAESRDLDELATRIRNTAYAEAVSKVASPASSQKIESALRSHLAEVHHKIFKTAGEPALEAYYMRFMIWNLKIILKGRALGKTQEELEPKLNLRAEELLRQRDTVLKALVSRDLDETVASLAGTIFAKDAAKAVALYNDTQNLQVFDAYFDRAFIAQLGRSLGASADSRLASLVSMDIDFYNIFAVARAKFWGLDEEQMRGLLSSYTPSAPKDMLDRMAGAASARDAFAELGSGRYRDLVPQSGDDMGAIAEAEKSFEGAMYRAAVRTFTSMFSPATSVGITKLTGYEVRNIASIAYAVEQGIPAEDAMARVVAELQ